MFTPRGAFPPKRSSSTSSSWDDTFAYLIRLRRLSPPSYTSMGSAYARRADPLACGWQLVYSARHCGQFGVYRTSSLAHRESTRTALGLIQLRLGICKHVQLVSPASSRMPRESATLSLGCQSPRSPLLSNVCTEVAEVRLRLRGSIFKKVQCCQGLDIIAQWQMEIAGMRCPVVHETDDKRI